MRRQVTLPPVVEVLPLYIDQDAIWLLRPPSMSSILACCKPRPVPAAAVQNVLAAFALDAGVVHSTSWRWQGGRLILTYLAILRDLPAAVGLTSERVERVTLARGTAREPAPTIATSQVVEHGLRHMCWLVRDDVEVKRALAARWLELVESYQPEPFRTF